MTATEELRRMLDERGVEYNDRDMFGKHVFHWGEPLHGAMFTDGGEWTELVVENATPEQAIDATLGRGTCKADSFADVQFIEDGKPESAYEYATLAECSACGAILLVPPSYIWYDEDSLYAATNYCPNCGAKVVDA